MSVTEAETVAVSEVLETSRQLLLRYIETEKAWIAANPSMNSHLARMALFVAHRAMLRAFPIADVIDDAESVKSLEEMSDNIQLTTAPRPAPPPKANA